MQSRNISTFDLKAAKIASRLVSSLQANGTRSTLFLTSLKNKKELEPLACKDELPQVQ